MARLEHLTTPGLCKNLSTAPAADVAKRKHRDRGSRQGQFYRNDAFRRALEGMDDLLKRADRAIEDSHRIRGETNKHLTWARVVAARVRRALQQARAEGARSRQLGLETTNWFGALRDNAPHRFTRDRRDQSAPDRASSPAAKSKDADGHD